MEIIYLPIFCRLYKKCPKNIQQSFKEREDIFRVDPFNSSLKTHKLNGSWNEHWSFSITRDYRVIFKIEKENKYIFYKIGRHSIYH
ncbi:MAG: hypothetical protein A2821_02480 [Candidatus Magasanikbacteria bacterium RIFCSPHIGHO2_01_FULL_41_23]|uniref:Toxin YoeB n=1 Tax=Candidatus Magasanikbacteria bacterium RIFCSPLOWO2_01_FULL_40_15 TaxID=1798686 RepID=A0A1F6N393_9BACT|nr:MAG: hypothetical protein A2821_02480 [Candidatus Magasanikbacteria bacterium RIFCSPHIGHO2_01_FULL_41_23]OGH66875.1 MAG: hypothetical protein A3C66_02260 [Candidatus Magasanikbacteria bacterium RIFCSPHIGHO2_02_FULL_41_35]OGH74859.1 MAG: hypothetical protein A3F22_04190 [Candidatus Magasanikbacteria bacterium RIFCSPHIGHO2_12_FULL_41_16]OGH78133.1 MAG: hypothetical protein A2983_03610 [Candidatus Magasanikbacteria bacterium RIFCSPLOWO2_01_FULL_40_15]